MTPITLERWRCRKVGSVYKDVNGKVYIVGYDERNDEAFLSAPVKAYSPKTMTATTTEGEVIKLVGEPGDSRDADNLWRRFTNRHRVRQEFDVSARYLPKKAR